MLSLTTASGHCDCCRASSDGRRACRNAWIAAISFRAKRHLQICPARGVSCSPGHIQKEGITVQRRHIHCNFSPTYKAAASHLHRSPPNQDEGSRGHPRVPRHEEQPTANPHSYLDRSCRGSLRIVQSRLHAAHRHHQARRVHRQAHANQRSSCSSSQCSRRLQARPQIRSPPMGPQLGSRAWAGGSTGRPIVGAFCGRSPA